MNAGEDPTEIPELREMLEDLGITGTSARERQPQSTMVWGRLAAATLISGNATWPWFSGEDQTSWRRHAHERAGIGPGQIIGCGERDDCTRPGTAKKKSVLGRFFPGLLLLASLVYGAYRITVFEAHENFMTNRRRQQLAHSGACGNQKRVPTLDGNAAGTEASRHRRICRERADQNGRAQARGNRR